MTGAKDEVVSSKCEEISRISLELWSKMIPKLTCVFTAEATGINVMDKMDSERLESVQLLS